MSQKEHKSTQVELLIASLESEDRLIKELFEIAGENLIRTYSLKSAKGGEFAEELKALGKDVSRSYHDQSMLSHLLNGLFPVWNILKFIEEDGILKLDIFEKKLYIVSFILHDIDKTLGKTIDTSSNEGVSNLKNLIKTEINNLNLKIFFPEYTEYLGDIAYIVVNTQERWGSNRFPPHFRTRLKERRLQFLTDLSTLSDLFASIFKSPSDVLTQEGQKICDRLKNISNNNFTLDYHKLADVRGTLTNIINNILIKTYLDSERKPLLFFPDGVVYLKKVNLPTVEIDLETIYRTVSSKIQEIIRKRIDKLIPGFSKDDDLRFPDLLYEVCSLEDFLNMALKKSVEVSISNPERAAKIAQERLNTLSSLQQDGVIASSLPLSFDGRTEITAIGRFLQTLEKKILPYFFGKEETEKILENTAFKLAKREGLETLKALSEIKNKTLLGGPAYKWFLLGAIFITQHPSCDMNDVKNKLEEIKMYILTYRKSAKSKVADSFAVIKQYLQNIIISPTLLNTESYIFEAELNKYILSKSKERLSKGDKKLSCILCNSAYKVKIPKESEVPFQNQAYRNKLHIGMPDPVGGICNICQIEFLLRQILFHQVIQLKGFEEQKIKYFYVYPSYYFTTQTARFVKAVQNELKNFNFYDIHKKLSGKLPSVNLFIELEKSIINPEKIEKHKKEITDNRYLKIEYPEEEFPTFIFFGFKGGGDTDTESWVYPALLALLSPYLFSCKALVTESPIPLFRSGSDFYETVFYDSIHPAYRFVLNTAIRLDALEYNLRRLTAIYNIHYETFKDKWTLLNQEIREIITDPISAFSYFDIKISELESKKRSKLSLTELASMAQIYWYIAEILGGERMGLISTTVDKYTKFYRAKGFSHYAMTRPLRIASESIIKSSIALSEEDIKLQMIGDILEWIDRIRSGRAEGYVPKEITGQALIESVKDFVDYFYTEVFKKYAEGDRAVLKKKINDFSSGCVAYYLMNYITWREKETQGG